MSEKSTVEFTPKTVNIEASVIAETERLYPLPPGQRMKWDPYLRELVKRDLAKLQKRRAK